MKTRLGALAPLGVVAALFFTNSMAQAQSEGRFLEKPVIADMAQTKARSLKDFVGRAVVIEFFAYW